MEEIQLRKLEVTKNASMARWYIVGNRCSKEFFEFYKDARRKSNITKLVEDGKSLRSLEEIEEYI